MTHTFVIAEAGVNHNGSMELALRLIDAAVASRADAVKFQTFVPEKVMSRFAVKAAYQKATTGANESQLDMVRKLRLGEDQHRELQSYSQKHGIYFFSTPFDLDSIDQLVQLGITLGKIPSGEITNLPYLQKMARSFQDLILSTGMSEVEEIEAAIAALTEQGFPRERLVVLHCNTEYPTPMEDVNLRAMVSLREHLRLRVGYSDHTNGIEIPIAAVTLGASIIEKHFTLDKSLPGPDHRASLEPHELSAMVAAIRNVELALGDGKKRCSTSEQKNIAIARKSIVAARDIRAGEPFTPDNIAVKRPGTGINPMRWNDVLGSVAKRSFGADELIEI